MAETFSTYSSVEADVRLSLGEASAVEWTSAQLVAHINRAEKWLAALLGRLQGSGRFLQEENVTLSASSETVALSSLPSTATKTLLSIEYVHFQASNGVWVTCHPIQIGDQSYLRGGTSFTVSGDVAPSFELRRPNILFLPVSSAARTLKVCYRWIPIEKTSTSDSLETPKQYDDLIIARTLFYALGDEGEEDSSFEKRYASRLADVEMFEVGAQYGSGRGERITNRNSRHIFNF